MSPAGNAVHSVDILLSLRDPRCLQSLRMAWMVADGEGSELAKRLIADTCAKQAIQPRTLTIHADRGSSMTSKPVAFLMADLGITKTTVACTFPTTTRIRKTIPIFSPRVTERVQPRIVAEKCKIRRD